MNSLNKKIKIIINCILILYLILLLIPIIELIYHLITITKKVNKSFKMIYIKKEIYLKYSKETIIYFLYKNILLINYSLPSIIILIFLINKKNLNNKKKIPNFIILKFKILNTIQNIEIYQFSIFLYSLILSISLNLKIKEIRNKYLLLIPLKIFIFYISQIILLIILYYLKKFNNKEIIFFIFIEIIIKYIKNKIKFKKNYIYFYRGNSNNINNLLFGKEFNKLINKYNNILFNNNKSYFKIQLIMSNYLDSFIYLINKTKDIYLLTPTINFIFGGFKGVIIHELKHIIDEYSLNFLIKLLPKIIVLLIKFILLIIIFYYLKNINLNKKIIIRFLFPFLIFFSPFLIPFNIFISNFFKMKLDFKADLFSKINNQGKEIIIFLSIFEIIFNNNLICGPISFFTTCYIDYHLTLDKRIKILL